MIKPVWGCGRLVGALHSPFLSHVSQTSYQLLLTLNTCSDLHVSYSPGIIAAKVDLLGFLI